MNNKYKNPYDKHLKYRIGLLDIGPRFYIRTRHMMKFIPESFTNVIDIGCGDGFFLELLSRSGMKPDGLDGSEQAIQACRERLGNKTGDIHCCFIEEFAPERKYDLVFCGEVLEHIEDDRVFLKEINRLTQIDGILILTVPLDMKLWSKADEEAGHFRRYTKKEIMSKLDENGFEVLDYVIWGYPFTRYLTPFIRKQQTDLMNAGEKSAKKNLLTKFKRFLKPVKFVFLIDNLFNFTERGVDIVIKAKKRVDLTAEKV
jgi:SAM-dependent methyltransferase